ncbi:hypothetical protein HZ326_2209 [Fusarium oxysporum f. sp. albedinis]|nr:hypothetical protein HZ326_2209 [Fusarium oxysporum f. sp. albedinis]
MPPIVPIINSKPNFSCTCDRLLCMQAMLEFQVQALSAPGEPIWALRYILSEIAIYIRYLGISPIQGVRAKYLLTTTIPLSSGYRAVSCRVVPLSDRPTTTFALAWPTHQAQTTPTSSFPNRWKSPEAGLWSKYRSPGLAWILPPCCLLVSSQPSNTTCHRTDKFLTISTGSH